MHSDKHMRALLRAVALPEFQPDDITITTRTRQRKILTCNREARLTVRTRKSLGERDFTSQVLPGTSSPLHLRLCRSVVARDFVYLVST